MKKLKQSKQMLLDAQEFLKKIETNYSKINKEYAKNILKLLERISIGENLDLEMLKTKYINTEEPTTIINKTIFSNINSEENISEEHISSEITSDENNSSEITSEENNNEEIILDKININNINYYFENKDNGRIFDINSKLVGEYKNKVHYIFEA